MTGSDLIFVQIASYRDRELPLTIASAISKADRPERLRFGICWQYDEVSAADLDPWLDDPRFRIDEVYYRHARGCCWARSRINEMYEGEDYTLQIDAHTRFADCWDSRFIEMLHSTSSERPLLTTYPPGYTTLPDGTESLNTAVGVQKLKMDFMRPDLSIRQKCEMAPDLERPGPSPFIGAGLIFTLGRFCVDVPYDPQMYFQCEELSLAARAYTHGYDLFYPNENLVWHRYDHEQPKHWEDRDTSGMGEVETDRLRVLLLGDSSSLGRYGLGRVRSIADYERHAGIRFASA